MRSRLMSWVLVVATMAPACIAAELPNSDDDESFDVEPPLLIPNQETNQSPRANNAAQAAPAGPERLQKELERATRNAEGADRLFKMGVLAKAEVEQRALRVVRLQSDLAAAQMASVQEEMRLQETRVAGGAISKEELEKTRRSLAEAVQAADAAAAKRERAELQAAEINLRRQQKLAALGIGRKGELARAEERLAELKAAKN